MTRRGNQPGNRAVREHARIQYMMNNTPFIQVRNINMIRNPLHKKNAITMFVTRARRNLGSHLPFQMNNAWQKLHEAYNIARGIRNRERQQREAERERRRPRRVTGNGFALAKNKNNFFTVVVNPGNKNAKVNLVNIKNNIRKFIAGNRTALNKWPFQNLIKVKWISRNGQHTYNYRNGSWYRTNGGAGPVTKNMIIENINLGNARV